jgi:hypothetical protein
MLHAARPLFWSISVLAALITSGCANPCAPEEVPTVVGIGLAVEDVRTLPILVSGATRNGDKELPDAHGRLDVRVAVDHPGLTNASLAFKDIEILGLKLAVDVDGRTGPVEVLLIEGGSGWTQRGANEWNGDAIASSVLTVWWRVDPDRAPLLDALLLPEGLPYTATVSFDWRHESCTARASGHVETAFDDFVQASTNAVTFSPVGEPHVETPLTGAGFRASFTVRSGLEARIESVTARAVMYAGTQPPTLAIVTFPLVGWLVNDADTDTVTPRDALEVRSIDARGDYATSGIALPGVPRGSPSATVLIIEIKYSPTDGTAGSTQDEFAFLL